MFDISFSEVLLIAVVALLVLQPRQLPHIASKLGTLVFSLQRYWRNCKYSLNQYGYLDELQQAKLDILSSYQRIKHEILDNEEHSNNTPQIHSANNNIHSILDQPDIVHSQPELDFNKQPELFD